MSLPELKIPFNRPSIAGRELEYAQAALSGSHWCGDGSFTQRCAALLETITGAKRALLTTSCTHALEMASLLLELGPGDEVILPSFTFVSGANAIVLRGARPVFVDIRPDTLNIDETKLESAITDRTRAISIVHYAGVGCAMETIQRIAQRHSLPLIEDNAHGLFGSWRGRPLGSFGALATLSFHETKNLSCGEGGALLLNDEGLVARAEILREKGTNRTQFFRGQVDKYSWVDLGSSYLPAEILAAVLLAQLEARETIQRRRHAVWSAYESGLGNWATERGVSLPSVPADAAHPAHLFHLLMPSVQARASFIDHMRRQGILAVFHYLPLHLSPIGRRYGLEPGALPVTEAVSDCLVRLPLFSDLREDEIRTVIAAALVWRP